MHFRESLQSPQERARVLRDMLSANIGEIAAGNGLFEHLYETMQAEAQTFAQTMMVESAARTDRLTRTVYGEPQGFWGNRPSTTHEYYGWQIRDWHKYGKTEPKYGSGNEAITPEVHSKLFVLTTGELAQVDGRSQFHPVYRGVMASDRIINRAAIRNEHEYKKLHQEWLNDLASAARFYTTTPAISAKI